LLNDEAKDRTYAFTQTKEWADASVHWIGEVKAGTYTASIQGDQADTWGCASFWGDLNNWGDLDVLVVPKSTGVAAYQVPDQRPGCPAKARANTDLIAKQINVNVESVVLVTGHMMGNSAWSFLSLVVDGAVKDRTLISSKGSNKWDDGLVHWTGNIQPGTHKFSLQGTVANTWGCTGHWGDMDILVLPKRDTQAVAHQIEDQRLGCPNSQSPANTDLIRKTINIPEYDGAHAASWVDVTAHILRRGLGNARLYLYVDNTLVDRSRDYNPMTQWQDFHVHWLGALSPGPHTFYVRSDKANQWGCKAGDGGDNWGDIDVLILPPLTFYF
jgi:hypothetical protein